ncbi:hypothetical protein HKD37_16G045268 [Glycine soja]
MAYDLSYRTIIVETDCTEVVKLVEDPKYHEGRFVDLASKIAKTKESLLLVPLFMYYTKQII